MSSSTSPSEKVDTPVSERVDQLSDGYGPDSDDSSHITQPECSPSTNDREMAEARVNAELVQIEETSKKALDEI